MAKEKEFEPQPNTPAGDIPLNYTPTPDGTIVDKGMWQVLNKLVVGSLNGPHITFRTLKNTVGGTVSMNFYDSAGVIRSAFFLYPNGASSFLAMVSRVLVDNHLLVSATITPGSSAADPTPQGPGSIYFNTVSNKLKMWNGTAWETITSA